MKASFQSSILRFVLLLPLAAGLTHLEAGAAFEAASPEHPPGSPTAPAYLDYTETPSPIANRVLPLTPQTGAFKKEPDFGRRKIVRGSLQYGGQPPQALAFAWDTDRGKLYLDLNGNGDLTDDPAGVFTRPAPELSRNFQVFTNVHLDLVTKQGRYPVLLDLNLNNYGGQVGAYAGLRSFWQGKVSLDGRDWQFAIIDNIDQKIGSAGGFVLLVRPWAEKAETLTLLDASGGTFPFCSNLFVQNRGYRLGCSYQVLAGKPAYAIKLEERPAKLAELRVTGKSIRRLLLTGKDIAVVLDTPSPRVQVPVGSYSQQQVCLKEGGVEAAWDSQFFQPGINPSASPIMVIEGKSALLSTGGPLTNSVAVHQRGRYLVLDYRLLGADGSSYRLPRQDQTKAPQFTIYKKGAKAYSGQFEFG